MRLPSKSPTSRSVFCAYSVLPYTLLFLLLQWFFRFVGRASAGAGEGLCSVNLFINVVFIRTVLTGISYMTELPLETLERHRQIKIKKTRGY